MSKANVEVTITGDQLRFERRAALAAVTISSAALRGAQEVYERNVLRAIDLGCGPSAVGKAAGRSESTIRGFLRRRKDEA